MEKRILKEIAKRWCKGVIEASQASVSFDGSGLTEDEMDYIQLETKRIAEKITKMKASSSTFDLVEEYYNFE